MKKKLILLTFLCAGFTTFPQDIKLDTPIKTGGKPLMEALSERHSERTYVKKEMPVQTLSNLLWAAYGFNRKDKRTVATAQNRQETDIYVMFPTGAYFYDAQNNILKQIARGDFRDKLGQMNITENAALTIIMVSSQERASSRESGYITAGYISQNIYLFAASNGLGTVARGSFDGEGLKAVLKLNPDQIVTLVQPVGYLK
jgi:nitroreductase